MKVEVLHIPYQESDMHLILEDQESSLEHRGVTYHALQDFLAAYPSLVGNRELKILALVTNFFFGGRHFFQPQFGQFFALFD